MKLLWTWGRVCECVCERERIVHRRFCKSVMERLPSIIDHKAMLPRPHSTLQNVCWLVHCLPSECLVVDLTFSPLILCFLPLSLYCFTLLCLQLNGSAYLN